MSSFGDYYNTKKKKPKKLMLEKKASRQLTPSSSWQLPKVEIIKKGKKEW